jgi:hypothetical protein
MLQIEKQETFYKCEGLAEPWKAINDLCRDNLKGDYKIIFFNITDCNKYPEPLKFLAFDWENLQVLIYREPNLKVYTYENYTQAINNILGNEQKLLNEGLKINSDEEYKSLKLLLEIEKPHKIKNISKGDKNLNVGDFLHTSWGYDQTNVELFTIKRILGKNYLIIQEIKKNIRNDYFTSTAVKVSPDIIKVDIPIKAYISNDGYMSICEEGYKRSLFKTDINQEHHETAQGYGH